MVAVICFFFPELFGMILSEKYWGRIENREKRMTEYLRSVFVVNFLMMSVITIVFKNNGNVVHDLNTVGIFAIKYMALGICISMAIPTVIWYANRNVRVTLVPLSGIAVRGKEIAGKILILYSSILLVLNLIRINDSNFWGDECYSIRLVRKSLVDMITGTARDVHPPLYYLFLMAGYRAAGDQGWMYHLVSLIPYVITLIIALTYVRKRFGTCVSFILVTFASLSRSALRYNVEVRMYSWAALFLLLSYLAFYEIEKEHKRRSYILFVIFSLLAAYTHYYALVSVAFFYAVLFFEAVLERKNIISITAACAVSIAGYIPWLSVLLSSFGRTANNFWLNRIPTWKQSLDFMFVIDADKGALTAGIEIFALIVFVTALLKTLDLIRIKKDGSGISVTMGNRNIKLNHEAVWLIGGGLSIVGTISVGEAVSYIIRPMYLERYLYPVAAIAWLLTGVSISKLERKNCVAALFIAVVLLNALPAYHNFYQSQKEANELCKKTVAAMDQVTGNDILLTNGAHLASTVLGYYFPDNPRKRIDKNNLPDLDGAESYYLVLTEKLDDTYKNWLQEENLQAVEIYSKGVIGDNRCSVFQLKAIR